MVVSLVTLAEAQAECRRDRLSPSVCLNLIAPFCGPNENAAVDLDVNGGAAFCKTEESLSPRQAAVLRAEAEARALAGASPLPWFMLAGASICAVAAIAWAARRAAR